MDAEDFIEEHEELTAEVDYHVAKLMEHFDAVQIMACRCTQGATESVYRGSGLWFARTGMAADFLKVDASQTNAQAMVQFIEPSGPPPPDEGNTIL